MATTAQQIANLIDDAPKADGLPVIFNGHEPRLIGNAHDYDDVDSLLIANRLSEAYLSHAKALGRECFIAHS